MNKFIVCRCGLYDQNMTTLNMGIFLNKPVGRKNWYVMFYDVRGNIHKVTTKRSRKADAMEVYSEWAERFRKCEPFLKRHRGWWCICYFEAGRVDTINLFTKDQDTALRRFDGYMVENGYRETGVKRIGMRDFMERYFDMRKLSSGVRRVQGVVFRRLMDGCGELNVDEYTVSVIDRWIAGLYKEGLSVWTIDTYKRHLNIIMGYAERWDHVKRNPVKEVMRVELDEPEYLFVSREEFARLLSVTSSEYRREIWTWAIFTGMRLSEIANQRLDRIDLRRRMISIVSDSAFRTKSRRTREVELASGLVPIVKKYRDMGSEYLFERGGVKLGVNRTSRTFKKCVRLAGLNEGLNFHDLRKSFGKWLLDAGVPIERISAFLGHSDTVVTRKYYAKFLPGEKNTGVIDRVMRDC